MPERGSQVGLDGVGEVVFHGSGSSIVFYFVWGGEQGVLFFHPWLPKVYIFCPQNRNQLELFRVHVQRGSLGMSPIF